MISWWLNRKRENYSHYSYYESLNIIQQKSNLLQLLSDNFPEGQTIESNGAIQPLGIEFGLSPRQVRKRLGRPNYAMSEGSITSLFYKIKSGNIKMYAQAHFYKSRLFLVHSTFSNSDKKPHALADVVANGLREKYTRVAQMEDGEKLHIEDENGNQIKFLFNGIAVSVYYISGDKTLIQSLKETLQPAVQQVALKKQDSDLILELV
jgi:hypothetical protein